MLKKTTISIIFACLMVIANAQWKQIGPFSEQINCIAFCGNNIYLSTQDSLYYSNNNGRSWQFINTGLFVNNYLYSLAVSGKNLFAGTFNGIYLSNNNGVSWTRMGNLGTGNNPPAYTIILSGNKIFAGTSAGVYLSDDNGKSWNLENNGMPEDTFYNYNCHCKQHIPMEITAMTINGNKVYAATSTHYTMDAQWSYAGVYQSEIDTISWQPSDNGLPSFSANAGNIIRSITHNGSNFYAATTSGVFNSKGGNNWVICNNGLPVIQNNFDSSPTIYYNVPTLASFGNYVFAGTTGVYFIANDVNSWTQLNDGFAQPVNVNSLVINDSFIFAGTSNGLWRHPNIANSLLVSANNLSIADTANGTQTFYIFSDTVWKISGCQPWITPNKTSGSDIALITLTATANPTIFKRVDTLIVSAAGVKSDTVFVTQAAGLPFLSVSTKKLIVTDSANSFSGFNINSNTNWNIKSSQSWIIPDNVSGYDSSSITFIAKANPTTFQRIDTIIVSATGVKSDTVFVTQAAGSITVNYTIETDSLALVDLYNSTNGPEWTNRSNWLTKPVNTWYGITILNNRVSKINLGSNNLIGNIPASLSNLTQLQSFILRDNQLCGYLPNSFSNFQLFNVDQGIFDISYNHISGLPFLPRIHQSTYDITWMIDVQNYIDVDNNNLTFKGLNNNSILIDNQIYGTAMNARTFFSYSPQNKVGTTDTVTTTIGQSININLGIDSALVSDIYAWYKNGIFYKTTTVNNLEIDNITASDSGVYTCSVTNPSVPGLTLYSYPTTLILITDTATLSVSTNKLIITDSTKSFSGFNIISNMSWNIKYNQKWIYPNVISGNNNATIILTATANPSIYQRFDTIVVSAVGVKSDTIFITQVAAFPVLSVSSNSITIDAADNSSAKFNIYSNINWNIKNISPWITPNIISGSDNASIILTASSNPYSKTRTDTIIVSGTSAKSQIIVFTQEAGSTVNINTIENSEVNIYPVPVNNNLKVSLPYPHVRTGISIYNLCGVEIYSSDITDDLTEIDMSSYAPGIYIVKITSPDNGVITKKIIKE